MGLKATSRWRRTLLKGTLLVSLIFVIGVLVFSFGIELAVKQLCAEATRAHPGDTVEALTALVKTDRYGYNAQLYRLNNRVIWALGQLGDRSALPFLRNLATGRSCDHETNICQGEVSTAIQKLEGHEFNLPAFLWRGILNY